MSLARQRTSSYVKPSGSVPSVERKWQTHVLFAPPALTFSVRVRHSSRLQWVFVVDPPHPRVPVLVFSPRYHNP